MLQRIFPQSIDNRYRGHPAGLWLFVPITFVNLVISLVAIFAPDGGAQSADGVPLNTFGPAAAEAVVAVVAVLGLAHLLLSLLFVLALVRYRAMIPLMYVLIVLDYFCRKGVRLLKPIAHVGAPPGVSVSLILIALSIIGLGLSIRKSRSGPGADALPS
jgi:hypothetical protein